MLMGGDRELFDGERTGYIKEDTRKSAEKKSKSPISISSLPIGPTIRRGSPDKNHVRY